MHLLWIIRDTCSNHCLSVSLFVHPKLFPTNHALSVHNPTESFCLISDSTLVEYTPLHELKQQKTYLKIVQKRDKELESLRKKHEKVCEKNSVRCFYDLYLFSFFFTSHCLMLCIKLMLMLICLWLCILHDHTIDTGVGIGDPWEKMVFHKCFLDFLFWNLLSLTVTRRLLSHYITMGCGGGVN